MRVTGPPKRAGTAESLNSMPLDPSAAEHPVAAADGPRFRRRAIISLLDVDDELLARIDAVDRPGLRRRLIAPLEQVASGQQWRPPHPAPTWLALQVLDGVIAREEKVGARWSVELLGTGDLIRPWEGDRPLALERAGGPAVGWRALLPARVAIIDRRVVDAARETTVTELLLLRMHRRVLATSMQAGTNALPRLEDRLTITLWRLAERWGRVRPDGVELPLPLTHTLLARLIGAERTSVSATLSRLAGSGLVWRDHRRSWMLATRLPERVDELLAARA